MTDDPVAKFKALKTELHRDGVTPELWARARAATDKVLAAEKPTIPIVQLDPTGPDKPFTSLMRGEGWACCCICFAYHTAPYDGLAIDENGDRWDVCKGDCAREAGISEPDERVPSDPSP